MTLMERSETIEAADPCCLCGTLYGPRIFGQKRPRRVSLASVGILGKACKLCYDTERRKYRGKPKPPRLSPELDMCPRVRNATGEKWIYLRRKPDGSVRYRVDIVGPDGLKYYAGIHDTLDEAKRARGEKWAAITKGTAKHSYQKALHKGLSEDAQKELEELKEAKLKKIRGTNPDSKHWKAWGGAKTQWDKMSPSEAALRIILMWKAGTAYKLCSEVETEEEDYGT